MSHSEHDPRESPPDDVAGDALIAYEQSVRREVEQTLIGREQNGWTVLAVELRGTRPKARLEIRLEPPSGGTLTAQIAIWAHSWFPPTGGFRDSPDEIA